MDVHGIIHTRVSSPKKIHAGLDISYNMLQWSFLKFFRFDGKTSDTSLAIQVQDTLQSRAPTPERSGLYRLFYYKMRKFKKRTLLHIVEGSLAISSPA